MPWCCLTPPTASFCAGVQPGFQPSLTPDLSTPLLALSHTGWRISLACGAVPALLLSIGALALPDTPNSLVLRGRKEQGLKVGALPSRAAASAPCSASAGSYQPPCSADRPKLMPHDLKCGMLTSCEPV